MTRCCTSVIRGGCILRRVVRGSCVLRSIIRGGGSNTSRMTGLPCGRRVMAGGIRCGSCLTSVVACRSVLTRTVASLPGGSCIMTSRISSRGLRTSIVRSCGGGRS